ncbi:MAG TPA: DUF4157 domain-containing protein [Kofleriaceae bacterium]|nr:DUF4157 domain-containing protein [Kofleriaceae bacterium]
MAERNGWRQGREVGGAAVERRGEAPGLSPGKRSLVEATFSDDARGPSKPGHTSLVQQLQRKQEQPGATNPDGAAAGAHAPVLVEDEILSVVPGQVTKRDFIAQLKPLLEAAAAEELGSLYATAGCPYIARYLALYTNRSAKEGEAFVRRFTGSRATTAQGLLADMLVRVRAGVRSWRDTGQVPAEVIAAAGGITPGAAPAAGGAQRTDGAPGTSGLAIQNLDEPGVAKPATAPAGSPAQVLEQLGEGTPLDSTTQARMGAAFGTSFADVRIHADAKGGALASQHGALAFTVGTHIAMAAARYAPGTVEGDALLAHELTHVLQQRGAAPSSAQTTTETAQNAAAEHDADKGAEAALRHLHGGDKAARASAKQGSDFQLQRCVGTAEAPTLLDAGVIHQNVYTWDGDPFAVQLSYDKGKALGGGKIPATLHFQAKYAGGDDGDGHVAEMSFGTMEAQQIAPRFTFDRSDGWSHMNVDLYGDGAWIGEIRHKTFFTEGWTPKTRTHLFAGKHGDKDATTPRDVIVKSKDAAPATAQTQQTTAPAPPAAPVRVDLAATVAKRRLDDLLADPNLKLDPAAAPWVTLKPKIDAAAAKYASTTTHNAGEGQRLTRVGDAMQQARPMLIALGAASHPEAFLPDIADPCLELVRGVRTQFVGAIGLAWDGDASAEMQAAMKAFDVMWYRVSSLYLAHGKGAGGMLDNARKTAGEILVLSNRAGMGVPKLEEMLGVHGGGGGDAISRKEDELAQVRAEFMAGRPGALQKTTKIVEDAQVLTGLASILVFGELFRKLKGEMSGLVGGAMDTLGRDLSAACDEHIGTFDGMAQGVEKQIVGFNPDLSTIGRPAVDQLHKLTNSDKFKADVKAIESRIKNIALVKTLAKVLAIVGAAALTSGVAGAAAGGALEGAGATAGLAASGEFAAEVVTFTMVTRAGNEVAFGKNETGLAEDLVTNAVMLGTLKAASAAYGRVFKIFADPKAHKVAYGVGAAATGFASLQAFAEAHYAFKHGGKMMNGDERAQSLIQNAVMFAALSLGGFLSKPLNQRVRGKVLLKVATPRLAAIEGQLADLGGRALALKTDPKGPDHAAELCKEIEALWNEELRQLGEAAKAEKDNPAQAAEEFKAVVAAYQAELARLDLHLSQLGLEVELSPTKAGNLFRPIRPGYVAYRSGGLEILKDFYVKDGGTLTELKDGQLAGKSKAGDEIYYVAEDKVPGVFEETRAKAPTEKQAADNHAEALRARRQLKLRNEKAKELVLEKLEDGHIKHKFGRIINGTGLAAALDANTLPGAQKGVDPAPLAALPDTIGVGTGLDTFAKLDDTPIGQAAPELGGPGWAMEPGQFTANHGNYAPASTLADATAVTQYRSGTPIVDGAVLEVSVTHDATWVVSDAKVRLKVKMAGAGEIFIYADATDIAVGIGKPRELELGQIAADTPTAQRYKQQLESSGRLVYGDQPAQQRGGKILVSGGSATAAWNARHARTLGAEVDWIAEDRTPTKMPSTIEGARRYERVQKMLDAGELTPDQAAQEMAEIRAFDAAALPTNVQAKDSAMSDAGIKRSVRGIAAMKPVGDTKVEVTFSDGTKEIYDQVVVSHSTDITAPAVPGPAGAVTLGKGTGAKFKPVVKGGKVVALESIDPPGAVRVIGAGMWSGAWLDRISDQLDMPNPTKPGEMIKAQQLFKNALAEQANGAPRDSPMKALVHHVAQQVPAANQ